MIEYHYQTFAINSNKNEEGALNVSHYEVFSTADLISDQQIMNNLPRRIVYDSRIHVVENATDYQDPVGIHSLLIYNVTNTTNNTEKLLLNLNVTKRQPQWQIEKLNASNMYELFYVTSLDLDAKLYLFKTVINLTSGLNYTIRSNDNVCSQAYLSDITPIDIVDRFISINCGDIYLFNKSDLALLATVPKFPATDIVTIAKGNRITFFGTSGYELFLA